MIYSRLKFNFSHTKLFAAEILHLRCLVLSNNAAAEMELFSRKLSTNFNFFAIPMDDNNFFSSPKLMPECRLHEVKSQIARGYSDNVIPSPEARMIIRCKHTGFYRLKFRLKFPHFAAKIWFCFETEIGGKT